jgi:hypothetical protein
MLSTMHQSLLGSFFLLMPEELAPQWRPPIMTVCFFVSSNRNLAQRRGKAAARLRATRFGGARIAHARTNTHNQTCAWISALSLALALSGGISREIVECIDYCRNCLENSRLTPSRPALPLAKIFLKAKLLKKL